MVVTHCHHSKRSNDNETYHLSSLFSCISQSVAFAPSCRNQGWFLCSRSFNLFQNILLQFATSIRTYGCRNVLFFQEILIPYSKPCCGTHTLTVTRHRGSMQRMFVKPTRVIFSPVWKVLPVDGVTEVKMCLIALQHQSIPVNSLKFQTQSSLGFKISFAQFLLQLILYGCICSSL